jgi:hypothetical protein
MPKAAAFFDLCRVGDDRHFLGGRPAPPRTRVREYLDPPHRLRRSHTSEIDMCPNPSIGSQHHLSPQYRNHVRSSIGKAILDDGILAMQAIAVPVISTYGEYFSLRLRKGGSVASPERFRGVEAKGLSPEADVLEQVVVELAQNGVEKFRSDFSTRLPSYDRNPAHIVGVGDIDEELLEDIGIALALAHSRKPTPTRSRLAPPTPRAACDG